MTVRTPPGVINTESTDSSVQRDVHRSLLGGSLSAFAGGIGAVNNAAHGVCGAAHLVVSQSGTPGMSVDVSAGSAFITGTASALQGPYNFVNDASVTLPIAAADATNPRYDLVIAQIRDDTYDGSGFRDARLTVVTGTPAASPSDPSLASYPSALVLSRVEVPASASSILDADITDLRTFGGWQRLTMPPLGSYTPEFFATSTSPTLGTGGLASGWYIVYGGVCRVWVRVLFGTSGVNQGSGVYEFGLPAGVTSALGGSTGFGGGAQVGTGSILDASNSANNVTGAAVQVRGSTNRMRMFVAGSAVGAGAPFAFESNDVLMLTAEVPVL